MSLGGGGSNQTPFFELLVFCLIRHALNISFKSNKESQDPCPGIAYFSHF
jgi:hypothetical protein